MIVGLWVVVGLDVGDDPSGPKGDWGLAFKKGKECVWLKERVGATKGKVGPESRVIQISLTFVD